MASAKMCNERSFQWNDIKESAPFAKRTEKLISKGESGQKLLKHYAMMLSFVGFLGWSSEHESMQQLQERDKLVDLLFNLMESW